MLLTRSPLGHLSEERASLDLHVLSTPPAFVLSQDQTLREGLYDSLASPGVSSQKVAVDDGAITGSYELGTAPSKRNGLLLDVPKESLHNSHPRMWIVDES